jgi:hypothetical protein
VVFVLVVVAVASVIGVCRLRWGDADVFRVSFGVDVPHSVHILRAYTNWSSIDPSYYLELETDDKTLATLLRAVGAVRDETQRRNDSISANHRATVPNWWHPEALSDGEIWISDDGKMLRRVYLDPVSGRAYCEAHWY